MGSGAVHSTGVGDGQAAPLVTFLSTGVGLGQAAPLVTFLTPYLSVKGAHLCPPAAWAPRGGLCGAARAASRYVGRQGRGCAARRAEDAAGDPCGYDAAVCARRQGPLVPGWPRRLLCAVAGRQRSRAEQAALLMRLRVDLVDRLPIPGATDIAALECH